jgi:hypothetical protein
MRFYQLGAKAYIIETGKREYSLCNSFFLNETIESGIQPLVSDPFNRIFSDCSWGKIGKTANSVYGIYQRQRTSKGQIVRKLKFYVTPNPRTEAQQANRNKFAEAIKNWQGLTTQQKEVYNKRAGYRPLSGYNLYIKEYMKSA